MKSGEPERSAWILAAVAQFERPLIRYATRIVGDEERAREVVQDTFLRLCEHASADLNGDTACWLFTVCRRRALDVRKKNVRMATGVQDVLETSAGPADPPELRLEGSQRGMTVREAVAMLPERSQEIVRLKFEGGLSYKQIAEVMNLSVSNVGFLLHTAIRQLRAHLAGRGDAV